MRSRHIALLLIAMLMVMAHAVRAAVPAQSEGTFRTLWGDTLPGYGTGGATVHHTLNQKGVVRMLNVTETVLNAAGGAAGLEGRHVVVEHDAADLVTLEPLHVQSIRLSDAAEPLHVPWPMVGPQPYLWILVKFASNPVPDENVLWFRDRIDGPSPSMDDFFTSISFGNMSLAGSSILSWNYVTLTNNPAYYLYDEIKTNETSIVTNHLCKLDLLLNHVVSNANLWVDFDLFVGINMCFNDALNNVAVGGREDLALDGPLREFGVTWLPQWFWGRQASVAHEMGHSLGIHHSGGPIMTVTNDWPYDSNWDLMSASGAFRWGSKTQDQVGQGMIAYDKDLLGWILPEDRYIAPLTPFVARMTLGGLADSAPGSLLHLVRIPMAVTAPTNYYTVEKRSLSGYDAILPASTVILHAVDPYASAKEVQARVVDPDLDGDPNDEFAQWEEGETFIDTTNKVVVTVESDGDSSAVVVVSNAGRSTVYVDGAAGATQDGSSALPWNLAFEGSGAVYPNGTVFIKPGTYGESMLLVKPMTVRGWGAGNVVIGE